MKQNTFYILAGITALVEVGIFWASIQLRMPILIQVAFVAGVVLLYLARRRIGGTVEDERTSLITQKAALRTLEVFWVVFFALSLGTAVYQFSGPLGLPPRFPFPREPPPSGSPHFGLFGIMQMALLALMILLYVGFRIYYARRYGEWDSDEEQD